MGGAYSLTLGRKNKNMSFTKQERKKDGKYKKSERDVFLLWGEMPRGWAMVKDLILCLFLISTMIGQFQKVDLAQYMAPKTISFVQEVTIAPAQAKEVVVAQETAPSDEIKQIVAKVYRLESSAGKNDGCRAEGKFNGYGFGWYDGKRPCYDTQEEVEQLVAEWFEEKLKKHDLATALCGYNRGFKGDAFKGCLSQSEEFPYYRDFLSL
jgi:hypothetical protein